ncbi:DUF2306 domain-containing protein [Lentibacter algarum]|uniref:DUF2306 domain-containing protein n=1 Tax=Lentibacter algarum TaxID=576131 RepID=UPI001C07E3E6|nr:DUF2306 domain-containing protein [Lentibacter algarum]MBU2980854.1 DUF2306 domain-containing protein [Lentibacter algarum]
MSFQPILEANPAIQLHLAAALASVALTPVMLMRRKGDRLHKALGRLWVVAMAATALSSFWISTIKLWGAWSPIHILSVITLISLVLAVRRARAGDIRGHKASLIGAILGLLGAGLFTLVPGRILSRTLLAGNETLGFWAIFSLGVLGLIVLIRRWRLL